MPRLFFAVPTPEPIRAELRSAQLALLELVGPNVLRLEHLENSHITLAFLGEVAEEKKPGLIATATELFKAAAAGPMILQVLDVVPNDRRRPNVIWANVSPIETLRALHDVTVKAAEMSGITVEHHAYKPHLTIARIKEAIGPLPEMPQIRNVTAEITEAVLVESVLGSGTPKHTAIARFPL